MKRLLLFFLFLDSFAVFSQDLNVTGFRDGAFPLVHEGKPVPILFDPADYTVVRIAAQALKNDFADICGTAAILHNIIGKESNAVFVGTIGHSQLIDSLVEQKKIRIDDIKGKWESFRIMIIPSPRKGMQQALVIAGSDRRGTAFGIFELAKRMGISPWKWWADVPPQKRSELYISGELVQGPPSVKYRGIFLNDEDWGLQPWAAQHMDTAIRDIGPNTYAKVFELLLRLKANYIWPAMHPCTRAFYYYPDNPRVANDYAIVVGTSHCEPLLRNNVFEWSENFEHEYNRKPGEWRYDLNKNEIYQYWKDRVEQSRNFESVYTVGMRGIHDGSMPGPKPMPEKVKLLQKIITDQRQLLETELDTTRDGINQIFCPYKEVLDVYRNGLELPDDITLVWSDDNHGYIRQLSDESEQKRTGRSGIYYHLSYWGSPHDYLWLSSISPALISYEMTKAYEHGADRLWVFNAGDIKPAELEIEFAMDLAWDVKKWPPQKMDVYLVQWAERNFGKENARTIARIKKKYYELAAAGKPEHLGMLQFSKQEEDQRMMDYGNLYRQTSELFRKFSPEQKGAFFQLVHYPVAGAYFMNKKIFLSRRSLQPGISKDSARQWAQQALLAYDTIQQLTGWYNHVISGGKWSGMMSSAPRNLAVFQKPLTDIKKIIDSLSKTGTPTSKTILPEKITIAARDFQNKKEKSGRYFQVMEGLGVGGSGVSCLPYHRTLAMNAPWDKISYLEYRLELPAGEHRFSVKCLPTQSTDADRQLNYAISINGSKPERVNIHSESESKQWKQNVLRGYAQGSTKYRLSSTGMTTIRIYFPDPGLVMNLLEIE